MCPHRIYVINIHVCTRFISQCTCEGILFKKANKSRSGSTFSSAHKFLSTQICSNVHELALKNIREYSRILTHNLLMPLVEFAKLREASWHEASRRCGKKFVTHITCNMAALKSQMPYQKACPCLERLICGLNWTITNSELAYLV